MKALYLLKPKIFLRGYLSMLSTPAANASFLKKGLDKMKQENEMQAQNGLDL